MFEELHRKSKEEANSFKPHMHTHDRRGILSRSDMPGSSGADGSAPSSWEGGRPRHLLQLGTGLPGRGTSLTWGLAAFTRRRYMKTAEQHWGCAQGSSLACCVLVISASAKKTPHAAFVLLMGTSSYQPHSSSTIFPPPNLPLLPDHTRKSVAQSQQQGRYVGVSLEVSCSFCFAGTFPT